MLYHNICDYTILYNIISYHIISCYSIVGIVYHIASFGGWWCKVMPRRRLGGTKTGSYQTGS